MADTVIVSACSGEVEQAQHEYHDLQAATSADMNGPVNSQIHSATVTLI